jgi:hypothetical protein
MTAYRQQALAAALATAEAAGTAARRPRDLKAAAPDAPILLRNVYGWFARVERADGGGAGGAGAVVA